MKRDFLTPVLLTVFTALVAYVLAYAASVRFGAPVHAGAWWWGTPYYAGVPNAWYKTVHAAFEPIHHFDRTFLRPSKWKGTDQSGYPPEYGRGMPWW